MDAPSFMSGVPAGTAINPDFLLRERGTHRELDAPPRRDGLRLRPPERSGRLRPGRRHAAPGAPRLGGDWTALEAHDGAVLALVPGPGAGFVSGGTMTAGCCGSTAVVSEIASFGSKWVEQVATFADRQVRPDRLPAPARPRTCSIRPARA